MLGRPAGLFQFGETSFWVFLGLSLCMRGGSGGFWSQRAWQRSLPPSWSFCSNVAFENFVYLEVLWGPGVQFCGLTRCLRPCLSTILQRSRNTFWEVPVQMWPRSGGACHPGETMQTRAGWRNYCVPLGLHGDGVAVTNVRAKSSKTAETLSWTSLLNSGPTRLSYYLIWFVFAHTAKKEGFGKTWVSFWRKLVESFRILWEGVWPDTKLDGSPEPRAGQPLAGGYWATVYVNRGDLEWAAGHFGLPRTTSVRPCALCACTNYGQGRDRLPWTDCNDPPLWEPSCFSDEVVDAKSRLQTPKPDE